MASWVADIFEKAQIRFSELVNLHTSPNANQNNGMVALLVCIRFYTIIHPSGVIFPYLLAWECKPNKPDKRKSGSAFQIMS